MSEGKDDLLYQETQFNAAERILVEMYYFYF